VEYQLREKKQREKMLSEKSSEKGHISGTCNKIKARQ
jgi:hypothetical protein